MNNIILKRKLNVEDFRVLINCSLSYYPVGVIQMDIPILLEVHAYAKKCT